jgi:two-component system sensor histidine kinase UhpB
LTNVARHAAARQVWLELRRENEQLLLSVRDDGRGFDLAAAETLASGGGSIGIVGMRERVSLLGGELEIRSRPGGGTEVRATLPLERSPSAASGGAGTS